MAVRALARADRRTRRRSWISLGVLAALGAGAVMAAAAGARRTDSAYSRFLVAHHAADIVVEPGFTPEFATIPFDDVARLPQVKAAGQSIFIFMNGNLVGTVSEPPVGTE